MTNILIGKTIIQIIISPDKESITFITDKGDITAQTYAECCSSTWIEDVELPALGFPALVIKVDDLEMPQTFQPENGCIDTYGFKITTDKGEIVLDYRNESNGYYSGHLEWPDNIKE